MRRTLQILFILMLSLPFAYEIKASNIYYVSADGSAAADGLSWTNATTLDNVLTILSGTNLSPDVIFVKKGTYNAPSTLGLGFFFNSKYVTIYGNCAGTESLTNLPEYTDATSIQTFINAPGDGSGGYLGRAITIRSAKVHIWGFDISGGDATKASNAQTYYGQNYGGAVYDNGSSGSLNYCKIHGASATQGGGMYTVRYSATTTALDHCEIYGNTSTSLGGGVYAGAYVTLKNSTIRNNSGSSGGGIYSNDTNPGGSATISNCIVKNNTGTGGFGGIFNKSGLIVNCLIMGNTGSTSGGGVGLNIQGTYSAKLINSTIVNNKTVSNNSSDAGGVQIGAGTVKNCIIWGNAKNNGATNMDVYAAGNNASQTNASTITYSCYNVISINNSFTYQVTASNNMAATDPLFSNASLNDFTLTSSTPCKNAGDNTAYNNSTYPNDLNNNIRIINSTIDIGAYEYFSTQTVNSSTNTSTITGNDTYGVSITAQNELVVDNTKTFNSVIAEPTAKLTINNGASLTSGTINLQSDATGTATFVNNGTATITTANVQQYLTAGRNWYIASPISSAKGAILNLGSSVQYWDEPSASWKTLTAGDKLVQTRGYISVGAVEPSSTGTISFSGTLNDGNQSVSLTRTGSGAYAGFNLIGNPYPSYLNAMDAITAANDAATIAAGSPTTVVEPTIWYRTKGATAYYFETLNTTTGVGTNNSNTGTVTGYVPPMQAFWVRVTAGQTEATLDFTNSMRSHSKTADQTGTVATTVLKAPSLSRDLQQKLLRLRVTNGVTNDEAIVVFSPNASSELDAYDSRKRTNNNTAIPEIYTMVDSAKLVINGLNSNDSITEIPLGFYTGQSGSFNIIASEVTNFEAGTQIVLKDKLIGNEKNITDSFYTFTSNVGTMNNRFSLIFKSSSNISEVNQQFENRSVTIYKNNNNRIVVKLTEESANNSIVTVYNSLGQELINKNLINLYTELPTSFDKGVYVVNVNINGRSIAKKISIH